MFSFLYARITSFFHFPSRGNILNMDKFRRRRQCKPFANGYRHFVTGPNDKQTANPAMLNSFLDLIAVVLFHKNSPFDRLHFILFGLGRFSC